LSLATGYGERMSEPTNSDAMTEVIFWEIVAEIGWPDVDIAKAKLAFMRRHDCTVAEAFRRQFYKRQDDLAREAAVDWCCDSWEYVRSHIVGLGQSEFDRHMRTPRLIIEREQAGNYA